MRKTLLALTFLVTPLMAHAGLDAVAEAHVQPRYDALARDTATLADIAARDCRGADTRAAYHAAFDAWMGVSHIQFGPIEELNLGLTIAYWPDPKNRTGKALAKLIAAQDPIAADPEAYGEVSIAAQGVYALERMLYDPAIPASDYTCTLTATIAATLAGNTATLAEAWGDYAAVLTHPGADNPQFPTRPDAERKVYTALISGLEFDRDQRLGRPLGTYDRPRPNRAEARLSERALRNITLSLAALQDLAEALSDMPIPETLLVFDRAQSRAAEIDDPTLAGVADPMQRFRIEALQQDIRDIQAKLAIEIGDVLGVSAGFNAMDGD